MKLLVILLNKNHYDMMKMKIGVHVSIAKSIDLAVDRAKKIGCNTFQIFTRSPRSWKSKKLDDEAVSKFKEKVRMYKMYPIFSHMPYLPNIASWEEEIRSKTVVSLSEELERCDKLSIPYIVTHIGSPKTMERSKGKIRVTENLNQALAGNDGKCTFLLENTAGKNNAFGSNINEICDIISDVENNERVGLCFDTCHAFTAGYDIGNREVLLRIIEDIEDCIGLDKLKLIHCNDSEFDLGEGRDKHEHIGLGKIGYKGFKTFFKEEKIRNVPIICETPVDERRNDSGNVKYLKRLIAKINK